MTSIGATGHQDIPVEAVGAVQDGVRESIVGHPGSLTGVSSLAVGADQLFAEIVLQAGGSLHVVVPSPDYETTFENPSDLARYRALLGRAAFVETLDHPEASEEAFLDAGHRVVDLSDVLIAVWDGRSAKGKGGTADVVRYARAQGKPVTIVWPKGVER